jgi:photosystem II stability/assembly factor-like uncharacterized protein
MFAPAISPADPDLMMVNCDMGGAYLSEDGGRHWRMIHHAHLRSDPGCRPAFHPLNPDVIYASSAGRLRVSRDRGKTFSPLGNLKDPAQGEIAVHPTRPDILLAGTRHGVRVSKDGGVTWKACQGPEGLVIAFQFERARNVGVMFAATEQGIWRSDDEGQTWAEKTRGLPWKDVQGFTGGADSAGTAAVLYCSVRSRAENGRVTGGIYRSRDRGETWTSAMGHGLNRDTQKWDQYADGPVAQYHQVFSTDAKPLTVYAMNTSTGFHPPHHNTVFRSDDGGETWRDVHFEDPRFRRYNVAPDWESASAGRSAKGAGVPFGAAICNSDPDRLILVRDDCHVTQDGGRSWFCGHAYPAPGRTPGPGSAWVCTGLVVTTTWHYYIDPFEKDRHYIAYTDVGMARSTDAGKSWIWWDPKSWAPWRNTCYEMAFDPDTPGKIWGAFSDVHDIPNDNVVSGRPGSGAGGVCVSETFGASWRREGSGLPLKPVTSIVLDPRSGKDVRTLYAGVFDAGVYKSADSGRTWTLKNKGLGHPENMRVDRVILHRDGTLFAGVCARRTAPGGPLTSEGVGLYRSRDGAETWEKITSSQSFLYPKDFSVDPRDSRRLLVGTCDAQWEDKSGGLYLTTDGGTSWSRIGRQGPQTFGGYFHPHHDGWIYMTLTEGAPGTGLWHSRNDGRTWQPFDALPFRNVQRVEVDPADDAHIYLTTFGGGIWRGPAAP